MADRRITRRDALQSGALSVAALSLAACGSSGSSSGGAAPTGGSKSPVTMNWITWNDHYLPSQQLPAVKAETGVSINVTLQSDDSEGYIKVRSTHGQYDLASTDALWAPFYHSSGLTQSFDINSLPIASGLYSIAKEFPFWKDGSNYLGYPHGWSNVRLYYNPAYVNPAPTSWQVLLEPKYRGKVVAENQPTDLMAMAGLATGSKDPYGMNTAEIARAKAFLKAAKPAFLKLVSQNSETVRALADGSAWLATENLGTDYRVKAAGGPTIKAVIPQEGVIGWIDCEQMCAASAHKDRFMSFINALDQPHWIAQNFLINGRPLFNEKAYKILVNQGYKERADALLYNQPELSMKMILKGPSKNVQAYLDAFNEVFAA
jgi:spermidine/putrescine-binding protein